MSADSVDPDETPRYAASHLGQHCLRRPLCSNTYGKYGRMLIELEEQDEAIYSDVLLRKPMHLSLY